MKVLKWILFVAATAASVAGIVYAVMHRAECCCDCVNSLIEKVKSFVMPHVEPSLPKRIFWKKTGKWKLNFK